MYTQKNPVDAAFLSHSEQLRNLRTGSEPSLGGGLRDKAV